jgi:hypothetical protein
MWNDFPAFIYFLPVLHFIKAYHPIYPHQVSKAADQFIILIYLMQKEEKWATKPHQLGREKVARSNLVTGK